MHLDVAEVILRSVVLHGDVLTPKTDNLFLPLCDNLCTLSIVEVLDQSSHTSVSEFRLFETMFYVM